MESNKNFWWNFKKIKNYLQIGNKLHVNFNSKSENKLLFQIEILKALSRYFGNSKNFLYCGNVNLIKILTVDFQSNKNIYDLIDNFYSILESNN